MVAPEASVLGHTRGMMSFARVRRVVLNVTVAAGRFFVDLKHRCSVAKFASAEHGFWAMWSKA
ncbi:hypothetical protein EAJ20_07340 [Bifidobacterium bifidum]|nr:hypothetical protein EAJ20_07340 [Bifidobacterium bifidum]